MNEPLGALRKKFQLPNNVNTKKFRPPHLIQKFLLGLSLDLDFSARFKARNLRNSPEKSTGRVIGIFQKSSFLVQGFFKINPAFYRLSEIPLSPKKVRSNSNN